MRQRPPTISTEDDERIREALRAPVEERAALPRLNVKALLANAPPSRLKPVTRQTRRRQEEPREHDDG